MSLLFANGIIRFSHDVAQIVSVFSTKGARNIYAVIPERFHNET